MYPVRRDSTPSSHREGPRLCGDDVGVTNGPPIFRALFSHSCVCETSMLGNRESRPREGSRYRVPKELNSHVDPYSPVPRRCVSSQ